MRTLNLSIKALIFCWLLTIFKDQFGAGPIASLRRRELKKILVLMMLCLSLVFAVLSSKAEELSKNPKTETTKLDVDEILGRDPTRTDYVSESECIQANRIDSMEVIDKKHIIVEMKSEDYFLIQFKNNCPDLRKGRPVMYDRRSSRLCRLDIIRGLRDSGLNGFEPGVSCFIPGFQSVSKEQVVLIRESMKKARAEYRKNRWRLFPRRKSADAPT